MQKNLCGYRSITQYSCNQIWLTMVSFTSPAHGEFKNLCVVSVNLRVPELRRFVYIAVKMKFIDIHFSVNTASSQTDKITLADNYTTMDCHINSEHNELSLNFVR